MPTTRQGHGHRNSHTSRHPCSSHGSKKKTSKHTHSHRTHTSSGTSRSHHHHHHHHHGGESSAYRANIRQGRTADLVMLVLTGIASIIFIAVGIWLLAERLGWPVPLNFTGNSDWTRFLSIGLLIFVTGVILLILFVVGFIAYNGGSRIARAVTIFFAALAFLFLLLIFLLCIIFAATAAGWLSDWWRNGWEKTRNSDPSWLCRYQQDHKCYGFDDNDCVNCDVTSAGVYTSGCTARQKELCPACVSSGAAARFFDLPYAIEAPKTFGTLSAVAEVEDPVDHQSQIPHVESRPVAYISEAGIPKTRLRLHGQVRTNNGGAATLDPDRPEPSTSPRPSAAPGFVDESGTVGGGTTGGTTGGGTTGGGTAGGAGLFTQYTGNGCKDSIRNDFREFMIPWSVFTLFLLFLVFLQFFFLCCVVSK